MKYVFTICAVLFSAALFAQVNVAPPPPPPPPPPPVEGYDIFKVVEQMPRFPGCEEQDISNREKEDCAKQAMLTYIYSNLKYPVEAKKQGIEGMAVVQFNIQKDGTLQKIRVVRDPGAGCGEAAEAIIHQMNEDNKRWIPGMQNGRKVVVQYTLPVKFKL